MPATSITRLRLRKLRFLPAFLYRAHLAQRQAATSHGFLGGYLAIGRHLAFWTVSVWEDPESMHAYRRSGAHFRVVPKLFRWCDEAAVATITDMGPAPPSADEAARLLAQGGRVLKVRHPSDAHRSGLVWPDHDVPRPTQKIRARSSSRRDEAEGSRPS
jgi:hypothetical protein